MVPQVALTNCVWFRAARRKAPPARRTTGAAGFPHGGGRGVIGIKIELTRLGPVLNAAVGGSAHAATDRAAFNRFKSMEIRATLCRHRGASRVDDELLQHNGFRSNSQPHCTQ